MGSLFYNIKQAFKQMFRNRGMSAASIFAILAMLLILGLVFIIIVNINLFGEIAKQDYDQVEVFVKEDSSIDEINEVMAQIRRREGVTDVHYRTEDEALEIMKDRWGENGYMLENLQNNPFPASIVITVESLDKASEIAGFAGSFPIIEDVKYYQETVEKLTKITNFLQKSCLVIMAFLVVVSVIVVSNTIKLTVMAREDEIHIMRYVGANNWFIRGPFLVEGIIIGLIAAILASAAVIFVYKEVIDIIGDQVFAIVSSPLISVRFMATNLSIIFLALGCSIGAWGSIISMRRFLKA
ncbi:MAG: permease-like cell division protein FtsX [Firmicutes bacterium]|nr:permease-like cell division protein FtsX [Bacillota bacterium]